MSSDTVNARAAAREAQATLLKFSLSFRLWPEEAEAVSAVLAILASYAEGK